MMWTYYLEEPLVLLVDHLDKGQEFACVWGQTIADAMVVSKVIILLGRTETFNENIRQWRQ